MNNISLIKTMKKSSIPRIILTLVALLAFSVMPVSAQTFRNSMNSTVGKIDSDGTIRNSMNSKIGKIESDGTIRNSNNSKIGKIESDGTIRNSNNSTVGKVEKDGTVRNSMNSTLGSARGVKREHAAVFFFFNNLQ